MKACVEVCAFASRFGMKAATLRPVARVMTAVAS
jgi:hypothetical protein